MINLQKQKSSAWCTYYRINNTYYKWQEKIYLLGLGNWFGIWLYFTYSFCSTIQLFNLAKWANWVLNKILFKLEWAKECIFSEKILFHYSLLQDIKYSSLCLYAAAAKSLQSCPTLCGPIDSSPPDSSIHGIFQARVLEWGAIASSGAYTVGPYCFSILYTLACICQSQTPDLSFASPPHW